MGAPLDRDPAFSEKAKLRAAMRRRRVAMAKAYPEAARVAARNFPSEQLSSFKTISGYHPLGAELDPGLLMARFAAAGAVIALPAAVDRCRALGVSPP